MRVVEREMRRKFGWRMQGGGKNFDGGRMGENEGRGERRGDGN